MTELEKAINKLVKPILVKVYDIGGSSMRDKPAVHGNTLLWAKEEICKQITEHIKDNYILTEKK